MDEGRFLELFFCWYVHLRNNDFTNEKLIFVEETVYGDDESKADLEKRIRAEYE